MYYKLSPEETDLLLDFAIKHAATRGHDVALNLNADRDEFKRWCRIIGELSAPTPLTIEDFHRGALAPDSEQEQQREFARREGLDFDKEFGPIDPRARTPRCVHGKLFSEPCEKCADRCTHGLEIGMPCAACGRGVDPPPPDTAA
jgi:hypothetical protein